MGRGRNKTKIKNAGGTKLNEINETTLGEVETYEAAAPQIEEKKLPIARVQAGPNLRRRKEPSLDGEVVGLITNRGEYDIYAVVDGWGQLEDGSWIMLKFTSGI